MNTLPSPAAEQRRSISSSRATSTDTCVAKNTAVLALGKLGGRELSATSDLDLVFLYDTPEDTGEPAASDGAKPLTLPHYYQRLGQRLINALTAMTGDGGLFDGASWSSLREWIFDERQRRLTVVFLLAFVAIEWVQRRHQHALERLPRQRGLRWIIYTALIWAVLYWGTRTNSEFMYFQF